MQSMKIEVVQPIFTEEDYQIWYKKNPTMANILLFLTENMEEDGCVYVDSDQQFADKLNARFYHAGEYSFRRMDH